MGVMGLSAIHWTNEPYVTKQPGFQECETQSAEYESALSVSYIVLTFIESS